MQCALHMLPLLIMPKILRFIVFGLLNAIQGYPPGIHNFSS